MIPQAACCRAPDLSCMKYFTGGTFEMGSDAGAIPERPQHKRDIGPFWFDIHLVTNAEFARFADATGYRTSCEIAGFGWGWSNGDYANIEGLSWRSFARVRRENHPVVLVSWYDAQTYAHWAGKRLPTEAEWEFVARSGSGGNIFPWEPTSDPMALCAAGKSWSEGPGTSAVGTHAPTAGLHDLVGNVWQWCQDAYSPTAYREFLDNTAPTSNGNQLRVRRGGAWNVLQSFRLRCSNRGAYLATAAAPNTGFRCAC